jgi:site-specific DNA recombinase
MAIRAALYHRVSTEDQALEGYGLGAQEDATRNYAELKGYVISGTYTDEGNTSRDTLDRPQLRRLFADA